MSESRDNPGAPPAKISIKVSSHPLMTGQPGVLTQLPMGELEQRYVHVKAILEDIGRLIDVINAQADFYNKRLIGKFMVVELLNFQENARKLYNAINRDNAVAPVPKPTKTAFEDAFAKYPSFETLRNKLAAHRDDDLGLRDAMTLWDGLTQTNLNEVVSACYTFFNAIHQSNPMRFRWFNMDGVELKGIFGTQASADRNPFDAL